MPPRPSPERFRAKGPKWPGRGPSGVEFAPVAGAVPTRALASPRRWTLHHRHAARESQFDSPHRAHVHSGSFLRGSWPPCSHLVRPRCPPRRPPPALPPPAHRQPPPCCWRSSNTLAVIRSSAVSCPLRWSRGCDAERCRPLRLRRTRRLRPRAMAASRAAEKPSSPGSGSGQLTLIGTFKRNGFWLTVNPDVGLRWAHP